MASVVMGGYWASWNSEGAEAINSELFTHLFCAFAVLNVTTYELNIPTECLNFPDIVKRRNPAVKALISVGGGTIPSEDFNTMAMNQDSRQIFINSCIKEATENGFDGIDLDWEKQTTPEEMNNLGELLTDFHSAITAEAPQLILTAALGYKSTLYTGFSYPIDAINQSLDWVNVMAYDFYAPSRPEDHDTTRPHSALRVPSGAENVSGSQGIDDWISAGVPANKLVLGLPFYGYAWKLQNPDTHGILAPADGVDDTVAGISDEGQIAYNQVKNFIDQHGAQEVYDDDYVTNYCYSEYTWITYDDKQAISTKVEYAQAKELLGYFAWDVTQDLNWNLSQEAYQAWR